MHVHGARVHLELLGVSCLRLADVVDHSLLVCGVGGATPLADHRQELVLLVSADGGVVQQPVGRPIPALLPIAIR